RRGILNGFVDLYNRAGGGFTHIATFDSSRLWYVVDAEFADNRNDIIYEIAVGANLVFAQPPGDHKDRPYKTKYIWQPDESVGSGVYLVRVTFPQQKASAVCKKVVYLK
ncbi:hypothetical protein KAH81_09770, partial [bacterium]|nr:hypothetical protein [bacterium]